MSTFNDDDHPRGHPTGRTRFADRIHSDPEEALVSDTNPMNEIPEWAAPGSQVFVVVGRGVSVRTITRATATQLIDDRGDRYPIRTMTRRIDDWRSALLYTIDDKNIVKLYREQISVARGRAVLAAVESFNRAPGETTAAAVEQQLTGWRRSVERLIPPAG